MPTSDPPLQGKFPPQQYLQDAAENQRLRCFHRKASNINNNRLKHLCQDDEVSFTNAWEHFLDNHDLFRPDDLHLNDIGLARLDRLLNDEKLSYSKNSKCGRSTNVQEKNETEETANTHQDPTEHTPRNQTTAPRSVEVNDISVLYISVCSLTPTRRDSPLRQDTQ